MSEYSDVRNYVGVQGAGHAKESNLHLAVSQDIGSPGNGWVLAASTSARHGIARWIYEEWMGNRLNHGNTLDVENTPTMVGNSKFGGLLSSLRKQELWIGRVACRTNFVSSEQNRKSQKSICFPHC